ncbi:MAG: acyl-CoA thioesterase/bile acid-CoA:amino acid N-acyltransferase family protein [Pseudomonadota bacterium]
MNACTSRIEHQSAKAVHWANSNWQAMMLTLLLIEPSENTPDLWRIAVLAGRVGGVLHRTRTLCLLALLCAVAPWPADAEESPPAIVWPAQDAFIDADNGIVVSGLAPGQVIAVHAEETIGDTVWAAHAHYVANERGIIDTRTFHASGGTWSGIDANGWTWAMYPTSHYGASVFNQARAANPTDPKLHPADSSLRRTIELSIRDAGRIVGRTTVFRKRPTAAAQYEVDETKHRTVRGRVYLPKSSQKKDVGVLVLGGSFGGLLKREPHWFAARGYVAMSLAYFKYGDLPTSGSQLPLEYFAEALQWFRSAEKVRQVVVMGRSRGGEAALLIAKHFPKLVDGVIAQAPSHVVNNGEGEAWGDWLTEPQSMWTLGGEDIAHVPYEKSQTQEAILRRKRSMQRLPGYATAPEYGAIWKDANSVYSIPAAQIAAPVLLQAGGLDGIWPSVWAVEQLKEQCATSSCQHWIVDVFPDGGHAWGMPGEITTARSSVFVDQGIKGFVWLGGTPAGNARAARAGWASVQSFLNRLDSNGFSP